MRVRSPVCFAVSLPLLTSSLTFALPAAAQQTPPDVVRLRDGSMFRGTISELVAGDHVDLVLANGQSRHFEMNDVASAGPAAAAPPNLLPPPPPNPPPPPGAPGVVGPQPLVTLNSIPAQLQLQADDKDLEFQIKTGESETTGVGWSGRSAFTYAGSTASYTTICTAPCNATLPSGTYHLGLSRNGKGVVASDNPVVITGPGALHGSYESHFGVRLGGLLLSVGAVLGGAIIVGTSRTSYGVCVDGTTTGSCDEEYRYNGSQIGAGIGVMVVGAVVGTVMMFQRDTAEITFVPLGTVSAGAKETAWLNPASRPQGLAVQMKL